MSGVAVGFSVTSLFGVWILIVFDSDIPMLLAASRVFSREFWRRRTFCDKEAWSFLYLLDFFLVDFFFSLL